MPQRKAVTLQASWELIRQNTRNQSLPPPKRVQQAGIRSKAGKLSALSDLNVYNGSRTTIRAEKTNDSPFWVETNLAQIGILNCP